MSSLNFEMTDYDGEFYDQLTPYVNRPDVQFFVEEALQSGGPVLEIGCGTGRVLIPTARAGIRIHGIDLSTNMLGRCREKIAVEPPEVREKIQLSHADMRNFTLDEKYSLATIPFRPFQHLVEVEDQLAALASIHRALTHDGRLILDIFNPSLKYLLDDSAYEERSSGDPFTLSDGRRVVPKIRIIDRDVLRQLQRFEMIYEVTFPDGRQDRFTGTLIMRHFFRFEVEHLLTRTGFQIIDCYSDYQRSPLGTHDPGELIFVAKKS